MTQVRAGPTAARQLADWGADVIQVQMPEHMRGDDTLGGQEGSDYQYTHRNKRSITLNLKEPEGIAVLKKLVATADVLLENFRPDVKTRLGIDYETLVEDQPAPRLREHLRLRPDRALRHAPRLRPDRAGHGRAHVGDRACRARARCASAFPIADLCGGIFAAYGVTVALLEREHSGKGQWLHTSLLRSDDLHDGFPDLALDDRRRDPGPGGQLPSHQHSHRRLQDEATATSTSRSSAARSGSASREAMGAPEWITDERSKTKASALRAPRLAQRRDREAPRCATPATTGSRRSTRRAWPAGASTT